MTEYFNITSSGDLLRVVSAYGWAMDERGVRHHFGNGGAWELKNTNYILFRSPGGQTND